MAKLTKEYWVIIISILTLLFGSGVLLHFDKISLPGFHLSFANVKRFDVNVGDFIELNGSKIRISVLGIVEESFNGDKLENGAEIKVDTGGGIVYGGMYTKQVGVNHYKIPVKKLSEEEPVSIYSFYIKNYYFSFLRIYVDHINTPNNVVTLSVFYY